LNAYTNIYAHEKIENEQLI